MMVARQGLKLQNLRIVLQFGATGAAAQKDPRRSRVFIVQDLPEVSTRRWRRCQGSDTCVRAGGELGSPSRRIFVGRCLDPSSTSSTTSSSCAGKPLPHPRQCPRMRWPHAHVLTLLALLRTLRCLGCDDGSDPGDGSSGAAEAAAAAVSGKAALRLQPAAGRQRVKAVVSGGRAGRMWIVPGCAAAPPSPAPVSHPHADPARYLLAASHFQVSGGARSFAGSGQRCRQRYKQRRGQRRE